jgi:hypothetical protein
MTTEDKLKKIEELYSEGDSITLSRQAEIDKIITPEVRAKLDEIDKLFDPKFTSIDNEISQLEKEIRDEVLLIGKSIKGRSLHAVYISGRVTWDTSKLEGLMIAIPQLQQLRRVGNPSVTIRKV